MKIYLIQICILFINSLHNIIPEPTRQLALIQPIILHEDMTSLSINNVPSEISDHCATYVYLPFEYQLHGGFTGNVWMYKFASYELLNKTETNVLCFGKQETIVTFFVIPWSKLTHFLNPSACSL